MLFSRIPSLPSHQKRSRPPIRCGSGIWRDPTERWVSRVPLRAPRRSGSRCCRRPRRARPVGELARVAVADAVGLNDRRVEVGREGGHARDLERPGCHDDLVGLNGRLLKVKAEAAVLAPDGADLASELHGELEGLRVALEVGDHLVSAGIAVGVARELEAGKAVVAPRREERERVPAGAPRGADRVGGFEDDEAAALAVRAGSPWSGRPGRRRSLLRRNDFEQACAESPRSCGLFAATGAPSHSHWAGR